MRLVSCSITCKTLKRNPLNPEPDQPRQSEDPVHFDLTDEDLFLNHCWRRVEVYRNEYKSYCNHFRLESVCGELFEFEITDTKVYQRMLYRVEEELKTRRVTVNNGVEVDGNTLPPWDLIEIDET
jgi:hypothetical protein